MDQTRRIFPPTLAFLLFAPTLLPAQSAYILEWTVSLPGPGNFEESRTTVALVPGGGIVVAGSGIDSTGKENFVTAGYDTGGVVLWSARYDGPAGAEDLMADMKVDQDGNTYVTGSSRSSSNYDIVTISYDATGEERWISRYDGLSGLADEATGLTVDGEGNTIVTGYEKYCCRRQTADEDFCAVKYDRYGTQQWVVRYQGGLGGHDYSRDIAADTAGSIYLTGSQDNLPFAPSASYATLKYDGRGQFQWLTAHTGPGRHNDGGTSIAIGPHGPVVTGYFFTEHTIDIGTIQYDWTGDERWFATYDARSFDDYPGALAVDDAGNVYVAGYTNTGSSDDFVTIKYDSNGTQLWSVVFDGRGLTDRATCLALDAAGNVYVSGYSHSGSEEDYLTLKYDPSGVRKWAARYNGTRYLNDRAESVVVDEWDNVYVTGRSSDGRDIVTAKYVQNITLSPDAQHRGESGATLTGAYPNPFNPSTVVRYTVPGESRVSLRIYNMLGEEVRTLVDQVEPAGERAVVWNGSNNHGHIVPSGVYFVSLVTAGSVSTQKLLLVK
jgi:hypothetical protein